MSGSDRLFHPTVFSLVVLVLGILGAGARCPGGSEDEQGEGVASLCPPLDDICPSLACVEPRRDDDGCPICECAIQACHVPTDCADRGVGVTCDASPRFCEPAPGCTDDEADTPCPAACFGRCLYDGEATRDDGYCSRNDDCGDGATCHQTTCIDDPTTPVFFDCIGWCASGCAEVETPAFDPVNGFCIILPDDCLPPGWTSEGCR